MSEKELVRRQRDAARGQRDRLEAAWNDERDRRLTAEAEVERLRAAIVLLATTDPIEMADAITPTVSSDWRSYANNALALIGRDPSWSVR